METFYCPIIHVIRFKYNRLWVRTESNHCKKPFSNAGCEAVSSCCIRGPRFILLGRCPGKKNWLEFHVHIHHTSCPRPLSKEWINHSRLSRPSAGPRKPLITGPSCLHCRPLIVLNESRCGYFQCSLLNRGSNKPLSQGSCRHVGLLTHPAPIGHLNSLPSSPQPLLFQHLSHCSKKINK